jgi:hypothetical protein
MNNRNVDAGNNGFVNLAMRLNGYNDRLAHRVGQTEFSSEADREAYEAGVAVAERAMGFAPVAED